MRDILHIRFGRDPDFTYGADNWAMCTTPDGKTHTIEAASRRKRHGQIRGVGAGNNGGAIYRLLVRLCEAGWEGYPFEADDARMTCLRGTVSRFSVPVEYGGLKKREST